MIDTRALIKSDGRVGRHFSRIRPWSPMVGLLCLVAPNAHGQPDTGDGMGRQFSVVPSVSAIETLTNNSDLTATHKRADLITEVSPTLSMRSTAGWIQGFLDYSLTGLDYARGTEPNSTLQTLAAAVKTQVVNDRVFIDASANVSRQNISPLGTQTPDTSLRTSNQTQVASANLNPYVQGHLGSIAAYQLGASYSVTHTGSNAIGNSTNTGANIHLGSDEAIARVNWALDLTRQGTDFSAGRDTTTESAVASMMLNPDREVQFSLRGGREANNIESAGMESSPTYGVGMTWAPSDRTTLSMQGDKHFFGNSYAINFQHRTAQTVWILSDTRGVSTDASAASQAQLLTAYDLIYLQLTSKYPDPIVRASQTQIELQNLGLNPLTIVTSGFLTNAVSLQRNLTLSFAYMGLRTSFLVSAQDSDSSRLDTLSSAADALASGSQIHQRSITVSVSHRLTSLSTADLIFTDSRSNEIDTGSRSALRTFLANWSTQLGMQTRMTLGARHSISTGDAPYTESALLASLTLQF